MTVTIEENKVTYAGTGAQLDFAVPFKFFTDSELLVIQADTVGVETVQVLNVDYTLAGAGDETGGMLTMIAAPGATDHLIIIRELPFTQEHDYQDFDPFPAEVHEKNLDRLTMLCQQLQEITGRSLQFPRGSRINPFYLPTPTALSVLQWDASGTAVQNLATTGISSAVIDHISNYSDDLATAVAQIGAGQVRLLIHKAITVSADLVIPSNIILEIAKGGGITVATGQTLTLESPPLAGFYQWITLVGTGKVLFEKCSIFYPEWWGTAGDEITDDTASFQAAADAAAGIGVLIISGKYLVDGVTYKSNCWWQGISRYVSGFKMAAATGFVVGPQDATATYKYGCQFSDFYIDMANQGDCGLMFETIYHGGASDIMVLNCPSGTYSYDGYATRPRAGVEVKGHYTGSETRICSYNKFEKIFCDGVSDVSLGNVGVLVTGSTATSTGRPNGNSFNLIRCRYFTKGLYDQNSTGNSYTNLEMSHNTRGIVVGSASFRYQFTNLYLERIGEIPVELNGNGGFVKNIVSCTFSGNESNHVDISGRAGDFVLDETVTFSGGTTAKYAGIETYATDDERIIVYNVSGAIAASETVTGAAATATTVRAKYSCWVAKIGHDISGVSYSNEVKRYAGLDIYPNNNLFMGCLGLHTFETALYDMEIAFNSTATTKYLKFITRNAAGILTSRMQLRGGNLATSQLEFPDGVCNIHLDGNFIQLKELSAAPSAPAANYVRIYALDNGAGKTKLMARFATGAEQQLAIEP